MHPCIFDAKRSSGTSLVNARARERENALLFNKTRLGTRARAWEWYMQKREEARERWGPGDERRWRRGLASREFTGGRRRLRLFFKGARSIELPVLWVLFTTGAAGLFRMCRCDDGRGWGGEGCAVIYVGKVNIGGFEKYFRIWFMYGYKCR